MDTDDDIYTDNPEIGRLELVEDFLPPPEVLAKAPVTVYVKVGIPLETLEFFQEQAKQEGSSYKRLIRRVLKKHVAQVRATESMKQSR